MHWKPIDQLWRLIIFIFFWFERPTDHRRGGGVGVGGGRRASGGGSGDFGRQVQGLRVCTSSRTGTAPGSRGQFNRPRTTRDGSARRPDRAVDGHAIRWPMTGVGGVTRTVARASDLSGARRTEFLFYRFAVEHRRRRRRRRHRRHRRRRCCRRQHRHRRVQSSWRRCRTVVAVAVAASLSSPSITRSAVIAGTPYADTRQSPHTRVRTHSPTTIGRARVRTSDEKAHKSGRGPDRPIRRQIGKSITFQNITIAYYTRY